MSKSVKVSWTEFKSAVTDLTLQVKFLELTDRVLLWGIDDPIIIHCAIPRESPAPGGSEQEDFENNYKSLWNGTVKREVVTQYEKNDKGLRIFCVYGETDANGLVNLAVRIPDEGRWVAYGDAEFEEREFGDRVTKIQVEDKDRIIAWGIALAQDPNAVAPVSDATVIALGDQAPGGPFPLYPILGHYQEIEDLTGPSSSGNIYPGMSMTFQYGLAEAEPVGGYAFVPGQMYFVIECQKATAVAGKKVAVSIDWAEPDEA